MVRADPELVWVPIVWLNLPNVDCAVGSFVVGSKIKLLMLRFAAAKPKFGWLKRLYASARNWRECDSVILNFLTSEASVSKKFGLRNTLRPAFPTSNAPG